MHIFILGMGHVGKALAANLRASGHTITGSTTTADKVTELQEHADEVVVLRGAETEKLVAAASDVGPASGSFSCRHSPYTVTAAPATNPYPRQRQPVTARSPPHAITRKPSSRC